MDKNWTENGLQMVLKQNKNGDLIENGLEIGKNGSKMELKWIEKWPKMDVK